jgi:hypothetical protein
MRKIILLSAICVAIASCNKESIPETPYLKIPIEILNYIKLIPDSWYIYKDSATGLTDSVIVTTSDLKRYVAIYGNIFGNSYLHYYNDDYRLTLEKVDLSGSKTTWLDASSYSVINYGDPNSNYWRFIDLRSNISLMQYPSNFPGSPAIYKIASAAIEGNVYTDIQVVKATASEVWWVKTVGIVKLTRTVNSDIKTSLLLRKK